MVRAPREERPLRTPGENGKAGVITGRWANGPGSAPNNISGRRLRIIAVLFANVLLAKTKLCSLRIRVAWKLRPAGAGEMPTMNEPRNCAPSGLLLPAIYIIDDDDMFSQSLDFLLTTVGYTVDARMTGPMLIDKLPYLTPGCIILDMRMPGLDGLAVLGALSKRAAAFPVIVVTGHGDAATAVQAGNHGAHAFLEKPVSAERLLGAIQAATASFPHRVAA